MEVKSAVLREGNYAMFPDCPSLRGQRHVKDLIDWAQKGGDAFVLFMAALYDLLKGAKNSGVVVKTMGLYFNPADSFLYVYNPDFEVVFS